MLNRYLLITTFILLGLVAAAQPVTKMTVQEYIDTYKYAAIKEMHLNGVPASITLSQGLIESGSGNSRLAREGNNHFGIKCKRDWDGDTVLVDDDEEQECFRAYPSVWESYKDHSLFLRGNQRYAFLFELDVTDYKAWAKGLKKAGYATNPRYADILIGVIERNKLYEFDKVTPSDLEKMMGPRDTLKTIEPAPASPIEEDIIVYNNRPAVKVTAGTSIDSVAINNDLRPKWVKRWNDLDNHELKEGDVLYLKPKKRKGTEEYHTVKEGESMWDISQAYAIKLKHLYKKNNMEPGKEPAPGETIYLKKKRDDVPELATNKPEEKQEPKKEEPKKEETHKEEPKKVEPVKEEKQNHAESEIVHTVKTGETLYGIAQKYNVSVEQIKQLNNLSDNNISEGQQLVIKKSEPKAAIKYHTVQAGDTLYSLSRKYGVTVEQIKQWNNLSDNTLSVGQKLIVGK